MCCSAPGDGWVGCVGDVNDIAAVVRLGECSIEGAGECEGEGSGEWEGEGSGEWEGENVILKGEVEGPETFSIVGNKATSWP
ncbi:hypothetical protein Tco_0604947, partial [Tanacetum coccineum]